MSQGSHILNIASEQQNDLLNSANSSASLVQQSQDINNKCIPKTTQ